MEDLRFMKEALKEAKKALSTDDVPIGAVVVKDGAIIARAHNEKEKRNDATAHAEILALQKATKKLNNWWLENATIYVTLEPCAMCMGAMINSRIGRLVFGAWDTKGGCCGSVCNLNKDYKFNHKFDTLGGVMQDECGKIITDFFKEKRKK